MFTNSRVGKATTNHEGKSSSWSKLKDPRIVRGSRVLGGKDRHSKVHTIKGLRDRRVRLSVSTAIQLYDLQDRIGLSQPSKVFDWLLDAAKNEIDELPPLQMPLFDNNSIFQNQHIPSSNQNQSHRNEDMFLDSNWKNKEDSHFSASEPINNSYYHWEATNFSLSHLAGHGLPSQTPDLHNFTQNGTQLMVSPPVLPQSYFPAGLAQFSAAQSMRSPFRFPSQNESANHEDSY